MSQCLTVVITTMADCSTSCGVGKGARASDEFESLHALSVIRYRRLLSDDRQKSSLWAVRVTMPVRLDGARWQRWVYRCRVDKVYKCSGIGCCIGSWCVEFCRRSAVYRAIMFASTSSCRCFLQLLTARILTYIHGGTRNRSRVHFWSCRQPFRPTAAAPTTSLVTIVSGGAVWWTLTVAYIGGVLRLGPPLVL